jgi:hypothetical protein
MGTASFPDDGTTFDALVRVAEESRFTDKRQQASPPDSSRAGASTERPSTPAVTRRHPSE